MPAADVVQALATAYGATEAPLGVAVPADRLIEALRALRDRHGYRYYVLSTAVDRGDDGFEIVHLVRNLDAGDDLAVRVALPKDVPEIDSAAPVYAGADWQEREVLDLFGVAFRHHPDPRRILMPDDYEGHPLRKDFAMDTPWGYRPATRDDAGKDA